VQVIKKQGGITKSTYQFIFLQ